MNYADNGFKGNSSGGGTPIVPRQHNTGSSMGYVGNGFVQSEWHFACAVPMAYQDSAPSIAGSA